MQVFKDSTGQEWPLEITVQTVVRVRAESSKRFDLYDPTKDDLATTLTDDLPTFWEALWYLCSPEAKTRNITPEQFGRLMAGDALIDAQRMFLDEWRDFFHRLHREAMAFVVEKAAKYQAKKLELVRAKLNDPLLTTLDSRVSDKMTAELNQSFGNLQESLDKTLGPSLSANSSG